MAWELTSWLDALTSHTQFGQLGMNFVCLFMRSDNLVTPLVFSSSLSIHSFLDTSAPKMQSYLNLNILYGQSISLSHT